MYKIRYKISIVVLLLLLGVVVNLAQSEKKPTPQSIKPKSNILFIVAMGTHSHRTGVEPLAHELVARGHNVSFLTPIKPTEPNPKFHEISTKSLDKYYKEVMSSIINDYLLPRLESKYNNAGPSPTLLGEFTEAAAEFLFTSPELKPWTESSSYDLIILEGCLNSFGHAIAYKFKAPVILFTTAGFWAHDEEIFGLPSESSWLPNYFLTNVFTDQPTFYDKVFSTVYLLYYKVFIEWVSYPKIDALARRGLELPDMPSIKELEKETRLFFTNQHFATDYPRALPPFIVQVGGIHCKESNGSLPKEIEQFIAGAGEHGFIYISLGSILKMSVVPEFLVKIFFDTIGSFKNTRFLWKWDTKPPKNLPENVLAAKWFPQQEILGHKRIKGFVTHCGHMSTQQAACHGVPMIGIPVMGDQPYNAQTAAHHRFGIHLELSELTTDSFTKAISSLINDPAYAGNAKRVSTLLKDRPLSPIDTAVYWTEYVLRHKNTSHMKPLSMQQPWWERRLLDVWIFLLMCFTVFIAVIYKIIKTLFQCIFTQRSGKLEKLKTK